MTDRITDISSELEKKLDVEERLDIGKEFDALVKKYTPRCTLALSAFFLITSATFFKGCEYIKPYIKQPKNYEHCTLEKIFFTGLIFIGAGIYGVALGRYSARDIANSKLQKKYPERAKDINKYFWETHTPW